MERGELLLAFYGLQNPPSPPEISTRRGVGIKKFSWPRAVLQDQERRCWIMYEPAIYNI